MLPGTQAVSRQQRPLKAVQSAPGLLFRRLNLRSSVVNQLPSGGQIQSNSMVQRTWQSVHGSLHAWQFACGTAFFFFSLNIGLISKPCMRSCRSNQGQKNIKKNWNRKRPSGPMFLFLFSPPVLALDLGSNCHLFFIALTILLI